MTTAERTDVLIVGAGPAGLSAALELKRLGVLRVTVVDREAQPGGMPRLCHHTGFGVWDFHRMLSGPQYARRYVRLAEAAGVEIRTETTVTGWADARALTLTSPAGTGVLQSDAILLATGVRERPRPARLVPGYRPRGVFTTGSLQRFVDERHLPVGKRAVIVGAEEVSLSAFMTLTGAGLEVAAIVTEFPRHQMDYFPYAPAKWLLVDVLHRVPVLTATRVARILGRFRVEGVEVSPVEGGERRVIPCDTVVFTGDWIPEHEVARSGGLLLDEGTRGPRVDAAFRTSRAGIFAAGNLLRGAETAATSAAEGRRAAVRIARFLQGAPWPEVRLPVLAEPPLKWVFPNALSADTLRREQPLTFRTADFVENAVVQVGQGSEVLHRQSFRRLTPNRTFRLDASWLPRVALRGEPVRISVA